MPELRVTKTQARRFLVRYHGFFGRQRAGKAGVMQVLAKLGSIQYDPLDVVTRSADLVLAARVKDYRPALLHELLYRDHALIDGWDKMMCIYPAMDFHRFDPLRREMERETRGILAWRAQSEALAHLDEVRAHVERFGPSSGADIPCGGLSRGRWGHGRSSSAALDYLFHTGELCVCDRRGTQRRFDLAARVLPPEAQRVEPFADEADFLRWRLYRRVGAMGLVWNRSGGAWLGPFLERAEQRGPVLEQLLREGALTGLRVEGLDAEFFCRTPDLPLFDTGPIDSRVRFLAPLDNMLWDRGLIRALFDFSYSWEVYVPEAKRKYGYYVLPILCGERFMGRFEPEVYRRGGKFAVKQLWLEPDFRMTDKKKAALDTAFEEFAAYLSRS